MNIDSTPQATLSVGIFANTLGFSIVLIQADFSRPVCYKVIHEITDISKISYELIKDTLADLKNKYTLHTPYQINNLPSLKTALGGEYSTEIREISNLNNEYTKLQSYWNDNRLSFDNVVENIFVKELNKFSKDTESHRLQALFLALSLDRNIGVAMHWGSQMWNPMERELAELKWHFNIDDCRSGSHRPENYNYPDLPENYNYKHNWF